MPWTKATRRDYAREDLAQASDLRDAEWALIASYLPPAKRGGRPRTTNLREVLNGILFIGATGCQWRALPRGLYPPFTTVQSYFYAWRRSGLWQDLRERLVAAGRLALGRARTPTAGVIDSQSVPTTETGGCKGRDAGKRVTGCKRHIVTDTHGLLLAVQVHAADVQDSHGAVPLLSALGQRFAGLRTIFADRVYRGDKLLAALSATGPWTITIIQRPPGEKAFRLLPRRWVVERTFAWMGRNRRLARDLEGDPANHQAWVEVATLRMLARRLARRSSQHPF